MEAKMKKLLILFITLSAIFSLAACGGPTEEPATENSNVIFSPTVAVTVINGDRTLATEDINGLVNAIRGATGRMPAVRTPDAEKSGNEIVIGETSRSISAKAMAQLSGDGKGRLSYAIYAEGGSVAIAYRDNGDGIARDMAIEALYALFDGKDSLVLDEGTVAAESIDVMKYYAELGEAEVAAAYAALAEVAGEEVAEAIRDLYKIYTKDALIWLANLYDPEICFCGECEAGVGCAGGAFYYSPSARDTAGYLPDAESTAQILNMLAATGMANGKGGKYANILPEAVKNDIITFVRALQDPNGYFYHPQWGKDLIDATISRRSRDLDWYTSMLKALGAKPIYDAPNGTKGEGTKPEAAAMLTLPLGGSVAQAVSKVVGVASTSYPAHLESDVTFREYLAGMDIENLSYSVGSTLINQDSQIIERDKQLAEAGKNYSLMGILIEWLNEHQSPETGHWHTVSDYYAINGLYKIARIYNAAEVAMNYADRAAASAIEAITSDEKPSAVVDPYNMWAAISNCLSNLKNYGGDEGKAEAERISRELIKSAPEAIAATKAKVSIFLKSDGSFSYTETASAATSAGVPAAVRGTNEGDVNATTIAIASLSGSIYGALGLSSYKVPIYTYRDYLDFEDIITSLGRVTKLETPDADEPHTFDDDEVGGLPSGVTSIVESGGYISVVKDPRDGKSGNVVELNSISGGRDYVLVPCGNATLNASCYVFEGSLCMTAGDPNYTTQIFLGSCYMLTLRANDKGEVRLVEASSNSEGKSNSRHLGVSPKIGEWFDLRVEYYVGTHNSVRIKVYFNGSLIAISDNYYDQAGAKIENGVGTPATLFDNTRIFVMSSSTATLLLDDLSAYKTNIEYTLPEGDGPAINVDAPIKPVVHEGFEDGVIPDSIAPTNESSGGSVTVVDNPSGDGKVLELKSFSGGRDFIYLSAQKAENASCYVFESDFMIKSTDPTYTMQITMGGAYMFTFQADSTGKVKIIEASSNSAVKAITQDLGLSVKIGEWFNVRVEYYLGTHDSVRIKLCFNGELAAVTDNYYDVNGKKLEGVGTPSSDFESVRIIVMRSYSATLLMDNMAAYETDMKYEKSDADLLINVDKAK